MQDRGALHSDHVPADTTGPHQHSPMELLVSSRAYDGGGGLMKKSFPSLWKHQKWSVKGDREAMANAYSKPGSAELQYHVDLICTSMSIKEPDGST